LKEIIKRLGIGHLIFEAHYGGLSHDLTMRSIELTGKEVLLQRTAMREGDNGCDERRHRIWIKIGFLDFLC